MKTSHISYAFLCGFLVSIFCLQWWQQSKYGLLITSLSCLAICLIALGCLPQMRRICWLGAASLIGISLALFTVARTTHVVAANAIDTYANNKTVEIQGTIVAEPDRRPMQTKYTVEVHTIFLSGSTVPVTGRVLATDRRTWPEFQYGDNVIVRGKLEKPGQIETFHYDRYLSRYDIYAVMYRGSFRKKDVHAASGQSTFRFLLQVKAIFERQINRLYAEPYASFMAGLLTGSRRGIPEELLQNFNITGLTHIIAISGYNITIVVSIITGALFWLPLKWRFVPAVTAICCFTLFVGASAAVIRAAIMGCLGLLALQLNRQSDVRLSVLWTLCFMLLWNPKYLWYDAGFQLSFLAVLGLVELAPLLDRWFSRIPQTLGMREALQMTCAAQLAAVPLIVLLFGLLSLIAPLANVLVAPAIPLAMLFGFAGTIVSYAWFFGGQLIAYLGWGCLEWIVQVSNTLAAVPLASIDAKISTTAIAVYYLGLISIIIVFRQEK